MEVIWSSLAKAQLDDIVDYYVNNVNVALAQEALDILISSADRLVDFPYLGMLISDNPLYRSLIEGYYKIIYSVEEDTIRVAFLFDTRQHPDKLLSFLSKY